MGWEEARLEGFGLYIFDRWRPNQRGAYLAACVHFATITGVSPASDAGFSRIPRRDIEDLQHIAAAATGA